MDYTINDAINILYACGITTVPTMLKYLNRGGFDISERNLYRKLDEIRENGVVVDKRVDNKRPKILKEEDLAAIAGELEKDPEVNAVEIKKSLRLSCSSETINRALKNMGYKYLRILSSPDLDGPKKALRQSFAESHSRDRAWNRAFFLDESTFQAFSKRRES